MDSNIILSIHFICVVLFLITYLVKTILLFSSTKTLDKYAAYTKVPEMIISVGFLATGIWLYSIIGGIKTFHIIKLTCVFVSIPLAVIGFKKHKKGLALLSLLLIIGAYGLAEMNRNKPFIPAKAAVDSNYTDAVFAEGALVFQQNCVFCHGSDGKKMYLKATNLTLPSKIDITQMVLEGSKGKMPAYKTVLSEAQIAAVTKYVMGIRPPADSTQSATIQ